MTCVGVPPTFSCYPEVMMFRRLLRPVCRTLAHVVLGMSLTLGVLSGAAGTVSIAHAAEPTASEILRKADDVRNPDDSYFLKVEVVSSDRPDRPSEFEVSLLGNDKTLIKTIKPSRDRGRNMLMSGTQMWAYIPNLKRAVRVSLSQRLVGQAANGDISRMRWSGDYDAVIEKQTDKHWTLLLTANKTGLTYAKLRVVVEKGTFHPVGAEYLTSAGKLLKKAEFTAYREICGRLRPTEIRIQDGLRPDDRSVIKVQSMEVRKFPASLFVPQNLE